jgi:ankyrin repeat protein
LCFPLFVLIAPPCLRAYERWSLERENARVGQFKEPVLRSLAEAIRAGDAATLTRRLGGKPPPPGRDRAGHDLLGYALVASRDRKGSLECVRALLEAGCDPTTTRMPDDRAPIHFMIADITPSGRKAVHLLLEHGADPNAVDPITGNTPIRESGDSPDLVRALVEAGAEVNRVQSNGVTALVDFVGRHHWESARYLVEQGARLDVVNEDGLSLDYYLQDWKDSVFGEQPEGWDRLRAAVAARGKDLP